jgi:hypothetical protein
MINYLKLRKNFFLYDYPCECIRIVKASDKTVMKNLNDQFGKYFNDNEIDIEIQVELHDMIYMNISEKQHSFMSQVEYSATKTLDNVV